MRAGKKGYTDHKRPLMIGAVIFGALVLILIVSSHKARVQNEITALHEEMSSYVSSYTDTTAGLRTLRAERYAIEARFEPIMAVAGSDTSGMRTALIPLQNEASNILGSYPPEERVQIASVLFPQEFLTLLPDLEDMRRSIIRSPSPDSVRRYDTLLEKTLRAYRNDISRYRHMLATVTIDKQNTTLNYLVGTTSVSKIIGKLDVLDERARELNATREKRYLCFKGERTSCTPLATSFATFVTAHPPKTSREPPTSRAQALAYRDIVHAAFSEMLDKEEPDGVVVKLSRSDCLSGTPAAYYYFFQSTEEEGLLSGTATPLNDLYFYDLELSAHHMNPPVYLRELYDMGLRYNFQNIGNLYFCPNSGHVLADTATIVSLHNKLKFAPLFADRHDEFPELARLEEVLTGAAIATEDDMDRYFGALKETLQNRGERAMSAHIGVIELYEMEEMMHEWSNRSSHFEQALTAAHHINRLSKGIIAHTKPPVFDFLISRVYASIFFMTFNQSVAGESFLFLDSINTKPTLANFHLVPYSRDLEGALYNANTFDELQYEQEIIDVVLQIER